MPTTRIVELRRDVLNENDKLAHALRARFSQAGVLVSNWVSSPGAGKTELLEQTLRALRNAGFQVAALVGDLETDCDARRLARSGAPVRQIQTHSLCHLEARLIAAELSAWQEQGLMVEALDFLFVENVGNLVCPAAWDLGEHVRVLLLSVTEGEDKPLKYPKLFHSADVVMLTKMDLAEAVAFHRSEAVENIHAVRPGLPVFASAAKQGAGVETWVAALLQMRRERVGRQVPCV